MQLVQISSHHRHVRRTEHRSLRDALERVVKGEVRFGPGDRSIYSRDASNYQQHPIGVVLPRDAEDVLAAIGVCRAFDVPVLGRGGGTSLAGQCCNEAVVFDYSKYMNRILEVNVEERWARVEPGLVLDDLRAPLRPHGLTFGPDPSTHDRCTLGGMIGNNSCGVHALLSEFFGPGSRTEDNVIELDVVTYAGDRFTVGETSAPELERILEEGGPRAEIYRQLLELRERYGPLVRERFPDIPRRVSGYNLPALLPEDDLHVARALVGSEGTCVAVVGAKVALCPALPCRHLLVVGYDSIEAAADDVPGIRELRPVGCEGIDDVLIDDMKTKHMHPETLEQLPEGRGWLLVEFGGDTQEEAREGAEKARRWFQKRPEVVGVASLDDPGAQQQFWTVRESGLGATAFIPGRDPTWPGWEDAAVPVAAVGDYLREFRALLERHGHRASVYGHFGQGCIHCRIDFDLESDDGLQRYRTFTREAAELVVRYGGSLSGEHGDGQARGDLLPLMYGEALVEAFEAFKDIWDPRGRMNPGKVVRAASRTENLALAAFDPRPPVSSAFGYPDDGGDFGHAVSRCVGVGACRRSEGGVMCPSFMATHDELHTTRGRARLLFDLVGQHGSVHGWADEALYESLDLCLACKGCKSDCPVHVDMATYKAEFLSHYYRHHHRPRHAYMIGLIDVWARMGAWMPRMANFVSHAPGLARVFKWVGRVHQARDVPRFATETFVEWFRRREDHPDNEGPAVVLWPDTFNNHFFPDTLKAATHVLESQGFRVLIPHVHLCCGRPLYDFGFLERARRYWRKILSALHHDIGAGTPIVGLEPSCVAAFRDELVNLFPDDERARRLSSLTHTLAEFLMASEQRISLPRLEVSAIVQPHCHHHAIMGHDADRKVLREMGVDAAFFDDAGCCGMAGAFGFERSKYEVSQACGEQKVLPAVREASRDCWIVADGFSCREQIAQGTGRRPLHLAELIHAGLQGEPASTTE